MRKRFKQQMTIGTIPFGETKITTKKRSTSGLDNILYAKQQLDIPY